MTLTVGNSTAVETSDSANRANQDNQSTGSTYKGLVNKFLQIWQKQNKVFKGKERLGLLVISDALKISTEEKMPLLREGADKLFKMVTGRSADDALYFSADEREEDKIEGILEQLEDIAKTSSIEDKYKTVFPNIFPLFFADRSTEDIDDDALKAISESDYEDLKSDLEDIFNQHFPSDSYKENSVSLMVEQLRDWVFK